MSHDSIELSDPFEFIDSYQVEQMFNIGKTELQVWKRRYKFPKGLEIEGKEVFNFNDVTIWGRRQSKKSGRRLIFSNRLSILFHQNLIVLP